jgi:hypothetical protein
MGKTIYQPNGAKANRAGRETKLPVRKLITGCALTLAFALCFLAFAQPAYAAWSWKSALAWSYSTADCTSPGQAASAARFAFGNTTATATCANAFGTASALNGWGGGVGAGAVAPGKVGSFGSVMVLGPVSANISAPSFTVSTTGVTFNGVGTATLSAGTNAELGAFLFTGDPNAVFGPETIPSTDIEGLIALGVISASDVLLDLDNSQIPSTFTSLQFTQTISSSQEQFVVVEAFATAATPEPGTFLLMGSGLIGLGCLLRPKCGGSAESTPQPVRRHLS